MDARPDRPELLDHEPPARRRLQRDLEILATEACGEPPHSGAVGRRDTRARNLTAGGVDPLGGDLRSVLVESHYDRHFRGLLTLHGLKRLRGRAPRLS